MEKYPYPPMKKMKDKQHPPTPISSADNKWNIFTLLKAGYSRRRIEGTLKLHKSTILGHIRDFKKEGLIPVSCSGYYRLTPKGYDLTEEEFRKIFNRRGGWFPVEIEFEKNYRFHDLFFSVNILEFPSVMPSETQKTFFSKGNPIYYRQYKEGFVRFHTQKAVLHIPDFTALNIDLGSLQVAKKLNKLICEIWEDGFKLDRTFKITSEHIADMFHPLACIFKTRGREVLVEGLGGNRLTIDFSHGIPELETENKYSCEDDMKKVRLWFKGLLDLSEGEITELLRNGRNNQIKK